MTKSEVYNNIRLADVIGQEDAKQKMYELVLAFKHNEILSFYGVKPIKGILLYGPPGTGKTLITMAISNEADMIFYPIDVGLYGSIYVNGTATNIVKGYQAMRARLVQEEQDKGQKQYGIFYMDECEALLHKRKDTTGGTNEDNKVINTMCEIMDGPLYDERILFIGTTNRKDLIDPALLRAGRFDIQLEFKEPTYEDRVKLYHHYAQKIRKENGVKNFRYLNYNKLAEMTEGYVGADIGFIMSEAIRQKIYEAILKGDTDNKHIYATQKDVEKIIQEHNKTKQSNVERKKVVGFNR